MRQTCQAVDREMKANKLKQCKVLRQNKTDWVNTFQLVLVVLDVIVVHEVRVMLRITSDQELTKLHQSAVFGNRWINK